MKRAMMNALVVLLCVALAGCGGLPVALPGQAQAPATIKIVEPASGAAVTLSESTSVRGEYAGSVASIRFVVNGAEYAVEPATNNAITLSWSPLDAGQNVLYLEALDAERKSIARSELVFVQVSAPQATAAPSPTAAPLPTAAPQPTAAPTTATTTTTQTTSSLSPSLTITNEFANLRAGPDTSFDLVGKLNQGQTASVLGKSADGKWWQIKNGEGVAWVFGELVQVNAAANGVAVAQAPALPTKPPATATPIQPTATAALAEMPPPLQSVPVPPTPTAGPVATNPDEPPCNPDNPFWGYKLNPDSPWYTFCTPVPFEFVNSGNPDEVQVRWHIYGDFVDLELRMDPSGDSCGMGSTGLRQKVNRKEDNFRINKKNLPSGGYKLGLFVTFADGRVQDWGELHFCGG